MGPLVELVRVLASLVDVWPWEMRVRAEAGLVLSAAHQEGEGYHRLVWLP